jgi:2-haloacid dehalogenase
MPTPKALAFDVFGTVVDWRSSVLREAKAFCADIGADIDPGVFADDWRGLYNPAMEECRSGRRPYTRLDVLQRETLEALLTKHGVSPASVGEEKLAHMAFAWRRLDPWPDSAEGIARLRKRFPCVTLSNGNLALTMELSRFGGLTWDAVMGAEITQTYKTLPRSYLGTAEILGVEPGELCLVASHHSDLTAARKNGLLTAYIDRPMEYGGRTAPDAGMKQDWEWSATSITDLADQMSAL